MGSVIDYQKGHPILHIEIEDVHNAWMDECGNDVRFLLEVFSLLLAQMLMEHLDSSLLVESHVLAQVDFGVATLSQQADEPVVAQLLSSVVCHLRVSSHPFEGGMKLQIDL